MSTLSQLFPDLEPVLGQGDTWPAFLVSVAAVWGFFLLIRRGVKEAAGINTIVTIAKIVPLALFLVLLIFYFDASTFAGNLTGGYDQGGDSLFQQVQGTMLVTVFVFLGIEGGQRLLPVRPAAAGRRAGHRAGLPVGAGPVCLHLDPVLRHPAQGG